MTRALILEDDACSALALATLLEQEGLEVATVADSAVALHEILLEPPDILIADWAVEGELSSLQVAEHLRKASPNSRIIFISGFPKQEIEAEVASLQPCSVYSKPLHFEALLAELDSGQAGGRTLPGDSHPPVVA